MVTKKQLKLMILAILMIGCLFVVVLAPALMQIVPKIMTIVAAGDYQSLTDYLRSFGWVGAMVLFALQFLQSLAPLFPQTILQIAAGATYGTFWGTVILTASYVLGNCLIFTLLRRFNPAVIAKLHNCAVLKKLSAYVQNQNPELVVLVFYLLPFLSNAAVPYLIYQTKIKGQSYFWVMLMATLPMMIIAVYFGDRLIAGDWMSALLAFLVAACFSIVAYLLKDKVLERLRRK